MCDCYCKNTIIVYEVTNNMQNSTETCLVNISKPVTVNTILKVPTHHKNSCTKSISSSNKHWNAFCDNGYNSKFKSHAAEKVII